MDALLSEHTSAGDGSDGEVDTRVSLIEQRCDERMAQLNQLFTKMDENRQVSRAGMGLRFISGVFLRNVLGACQCNENDG